MLESTLVAMGWVVSNWLIAGVRPEPMGNENMTASPSGTFRTGDGPAQHRGEPAAAVRDAVPADRAAGACARSALCRPRGPQAPSLRAERGDRAGAGGALRRRNGRALMNDSGVPAGEVLDVPSVLEHPQIVERGLLHTFDDVPRSIEPSAWCARASGSKAAIRRRPRRRRRSAPTPRACSPSSAIPRARSKSCRATRRSRNAMAKSDQAPEDAGRLVVDLDHRHEARHDPLPRLCHRGPDRPRRASPRWSI